MITRTRIAIILLTAPVLAFVIVGGLLARTVDRPETYPHLRVFDDVVSLTTSNYVEAVDTDRLMRGAMHGLAEALDADSAYLPPEDVKATAGDLPRPSGEIGLELTRQFYLRVIAVRDGSPAARAGIRGGDFLRVIDRRPTRDLSVWEGARLLRGDPGTTVTLTVLRGNAADPHVVTVTREALAPPVVSRRMAAEGVGFVRVPGFTDGTPEAMRDAVAQLQREGARALILDLRNTATGPLSAGLAAARLFVASGTLAQLEARGASRQVVSAGPGDGAIALPLAVLVDGGTAGAAELFAAAVAGTLRGDLVGERTAGRAALQRLAPLPDGSALWMSYARYLTAAGDPIHERGLAPGVAVAQPDVEFGAAPPAEDPVIEKAVDHLRAKAGSASAARAPEPSRQRPVRS